MRDEPDTRQKRWLMRQVWHDLLFLHWTLPPETLQGQLPSGLTLDTFEGSAWVAVVPFWMSRVRMAGLAALPGLSRFQELNLRTYCRLRDGRPAVWFFSLECNHALAVWFARRFFHLNYVRATIDMTCDGDTLDYRWGRRGGPVGPAGRPLGEVTYASRFQYRGDGPERAAEPCSLEHFLLERYHLVARAPGGLQVGEVVHAPYRHRAAAVTTWDANLFAANDLEPPSRPPDHTCYVERVEVTVPGLPRPIVSS
jgi:uncharacterized protein YqjF (DUF2071 family)